MFTALRYFHETVRAGSIRRAAEALHVSPSSVSRQIMSLEREFDVPLLERTGQGVRLTSAGELLARHTDRTFRDLGRVRGWIDDLKGLRRGHVVAYVIEGMVAEFVPSILTTFRSRYPAITFSLATAATDRLLEALIRDEADIAVVYNAPERSDIVTVLEYVEPLRCLVPPGHPLAGHAELTVRDLVGEPLALPDPTFGLRRMIDAGFRRHNCVPTVAIDTNSLELTKQAALSGMAISFRPAVTTLTEAEAAAITVVPVRADEIAPGRTALCVHRDRELPFAAAEFLRLMVLKFTELADRGVGEITSQSVAFSATHWR
ncbi:LysR family transcriptional regulator [Acuticoccus mangrovi]|uniref:LysR family transcriptional regulator n=1 Tax=Acuticoccus mangrovi TaxID=2796142 RepID=A0A934IQI6_9HYPH|nr:LysR family transcriptional regulator [Acuticoccus mangrovi]MBJ3776768.1 LysR family transcriptional regulator [Acuticoccus mangrovi]